MPKKLVVAESSSPAPAASLVLIGTNEAANTRSATFRLERSRISTSLYSLGLDGTRTIKYDQITVIRMKKGLPLSTNYPAIRPQSVQAFLMQSRFSRLSLLRFIGLPYNWAHIISCGIR